MIATGKEVPPAAASDWPAIWVVFSAGLVAGAYVTKVAPALPVLRAELDLTLVESGFIASAFNIVGMAVGMLAGVLCDRLGHKRLALGGLAVLAAGGALGAAAWSYSSVLSARFLEGMGFILVTVSAPALMSAATVTPRDRVHALGLWSAYMPTGGSLALLAAPWLIAACGWRGLWAALALAAAACAIVFARTVPVARHGQVSSLRLALESLRQKGSMVLALLFACYVAQWTSIMIWLPTFLIDEHGITDSAAAAAAALMVLCNVPGNLAGGWLLARGIGRGALVLAASAIAALCEAGMVAEVLPGALRYALVLAFSLCAGVIPAAVFAGLPVHAKTPQHIGTANGIVMQASQIGQFLGPLALAWLASRAGGWHAALWPMLALAGGCALCGLALRRLEHRVPAAG